MTISEFLKIYDTLGNFSFQKCIISKNYQYVRSFGLDERNNLNADTVCRCRCDSKLFAPFSFEDFLIEGNTITLKRQEFELKINGIRCFENLEIKDVNQSQILGFAGIYDKITKSNTFSVELYGNDFLYNIIQKKIDNIDSLTRIFIPNKENIISLYGLSDISPFHFVKDGLYHYDYFFMFH